MKIHLQVDASLLTDYADKLSSYGVKLALKRAVSQTMTVVAKQTKADIKKETGVTWGDAVGSIRRPTLNDLSASVDYKHRKIGIINVAGVRFSPGQGLTGSGWQLSAGGSIHVKRAFLIRAGTKAAGKVVGTSTKPPGKVVSTSTKGDGKSYVVYRTGPNRYPLRAVVATSPSVAMGRGDGAGSQTIVKRWTALANAELNRRATIELQKQLDKPGSGGAER